MATTLSQSWVAPSVIQARWASLAGGDNGDSWECPQFGDKTVTVTGTFGTSTVTFQGSNDGTNWFTLEDFTGTPITGKTAAAMETIGNNPRYIRPSVSAGTGSGLDVIILARGAAR